MFDHRYGVQFSTYEKAKVEVGVQVVERWILARLRDRTATSPAHWTSTPSP